MMGGNHQIRTDVWCGECVGAAAEFPGNSVHLTDRQEGRQQNPDPCSKEPQGESIAAGDGCGACEMFSHDVPMVSA